MTRRPADSPGEWVATPPGGARSERPARPPRPYTGPPSYPATPRWGFPLLTWRWPLALTRRTRTDASDRLVPLSATAESVLWGTAGIAGIATLAEVWRYVLLVRSRAEALPRVALGMSDALVGAAGVLSVLLGIACGIFVVLWTLRARELAAEHTGMSSPRPDWQFIVGVLVPGANLLIPGSVLAELEHAALVGEGAARGRRPKPSRLVGAWWAVWAASLLLGWATFLWGFQDSVQAMADGVLLHAWNDLAVCVLAVLTVRVVRYLTRLLMPLDPTELPRMRVLDVHDAPAPERAERPGDAAR